MSLNVSIKLSNNLVQVYPGENAELAITVVNNSRGIQRFEVRLADLETSWYQLDWSEMLLYPDPPGNEGTIYLRLNIPAEAMSGSYAPSVELFSDSEQEVVARQSFALNISDQQGGEASIAVLPPVQRIRGRGARYQLQLNNDQTRPTSMVLAVRSNNPAANFRITPTNLQLPALSKGMALLEIFPHTSNWIKADEAFDFTVGVTNLGLEADGHLVQTCRLPWLRTILVTPLLLFFSILMPLLLSIAIIVILWPRPHTNNGIDVAARTPSRCAVSDTSLNPNIIMDEQFGTIIINTPDGSRQAVVSEDINRLPGIFASLISVSPDGKRLAYLTADDTSMHKAQLWIATTGVFNKKVLIAGVDDGFWPSRPLWSPDGKLLSYVKRGTAANTGNLELWTVGVADTEKKQVQLKTPPTLIPGAFYGDSGNGPVCWSRDGARLIVAGIQDTNQYEVNIQGGDFQPLPKPSPEVQPAIGLTDSKSVYSMAAATPGVIEPPLPPLGNADCFVKTFSMNDPAWADQPIKSNTDYPTDKISTNGCAITAAAMVLDSYKATTTDPNSLNQCLGTQAAPFNWLSLIGCSNGKLSVSERNEFSWAGLNQLLGQGQPAIVGLLGGQTGVHFVVVVSGADGIASTYRVNDPWDGSNNKSLAYYISKGYQPSWLINLGPNSPLVCKERNPSLKNLKPEFKLSQAVPEDGKSYRLPVVLNFQAEGNLSTIAKLYTLVSGTPTAQVSPVVSGTNPGPDPIVATLVTNGTPVTQDGFYELVIETPATNGTISRLTTHFVIDRAFPVGKKIPLKNNVLSDGGENGLQIARGRVDLELGAVDRLSRVSLIQYQINGGEFKTYSDDISAKPIKFDADGIYVVNYRIADGAGNVSQPQEALRFQLQRTIPPVVGQPTPTVAGAVANLVITSAPVVVNNNNITASSNNINNPAPANNNVQVAQTTAPNPAGVVATQPVATTPAATVPVVPASVLVANPAQISFELGVDTSFQLINAGTALVNWTLQPASGPGAGLLKFNQTAGVVAPGGNSTVPIHLANFNFGSAPITATFTILYNNNTASLIVPVTINPQPPAQANFTSPSAGPLITNSVAVKLQVTSVSGGATPNHASFSAKYSDVLNGSPTDHPITGQGTLANGWSINWDISALPPQPTIEIDAKVCWTADETACNVVSPALTGLSIPRPTATYTITPTGDKLFGIVNIGAQVTGRFDHISYYYVATAGSVAGPSTSLATRATPANLTVAWDTGLIPPNRTIKLTAVLCITAAEPDNNCTTSVLPNNFSIEQPTITINPLSDADAKSIPIQFAAGLSGNLTKLNLPASGSTAQVFVTAKFVKTSTAETTTLNLAGATINSLSNGAGTWSLAPIDTSTWRSGTTVSFSAQICWDGQKDGPNCFLTQTPAVGNVEKLTAIVTPLTTDLGLPTDIKATLPASTRANKVLLSITYARWLDGKPVTKSNLPMTGSPASGFVYPAFDTAAQGLKPDQTLDFTVIACNGTDCGSDSDKVQAKIPLTTISQLTPATLGTLQGSSVVVTPTLAGRGVTKLALVAGFKNQANFTAGTVVTNSIQTAGPIQIGQSHAFTWTLFDPSPSSAASVPPQSGINMNFMFCWGDTTTWDTGCLDNSPVSYPSLTIPDPVITSVSFNNLPYDPASHPGSGPFLPIPVNSNATQVSFPVTATVSASYNVNYVGWQLEIFDTVSSSTSITQTQLIGLAGSSSAGKLTFDLQNLDIFNPQNTYTLVAYPGWGRSNPPLCCQIAADEKRIPIKFIQNTADFAMLSNHSLNKTLLAVPQSNADGDPASRVMVDRETQINLTFLNDFSTIQRVVFYVSADGTNPRAPEKLTSGVITTTPGSGQWQMKWDHITGTLLDPRSNLIISWLVCNTQTDDSGCLPIETTGLSNSVNQLVLGGLNIQPSLSSQFLDPNLNNNTNNDPNDYFTSSFNVGLTSPISTTVIKQVRFIAYPTPKTGTSPDPNSLVLLLTHPLPSSASGNIYSQTVYWPDEVVNSQVKSNIKNFVDAVQQINGLVTISAQYCLSSTPNLAYNDPSCSEWSGTDLKQFKAKTSPVPLVKVDGRQAAIINWLPYSPPGQNTLDNSYYPYSTWLQDVQPGTTTSLITRTLMIEVVPLISSTSMTLTVPDVSYSFNNNNPCPSPNDTSSQKTRIGTTSAAIITPTLALGYNYSIYVYDWNVQSIKDMPLNDNITRGVCLFANPTFNLASDPAGTSPRLTGAATLTHGQILKGYSFSAANPAGRAQAAPITATPTPTLIPPPVITPSSPTLPPTTTNGPTLPPANTVSPIRATPAIPTIFPSPQPTPTPRTYTTVPATRYASPTQIPTPTP